MVSGFTFVKLISLARTGNNFCPGKSFSIETIGGVAVRYIDFLSYSRNIKYLPVASSDYPSVFFVCFSCILLIYVLN